MTDLSSLAAARSAHEAGDLTRAIEGYRAILAGGPNPEASNLLAIALDGSGAAGAAEDVLSRAFAEHPDDPAIALNLARLRIRRGALAEALAPLRVASAKGDAAALGLHFESAWVSGSHGDVLSTGNRLLAAGALDQSQTERFAEMALRVGAPDADGILASGLDRYPGSPRLHLILAHGLVKQSAPGDAVTSFRRSLCLAPTDLDPAHNLARTLDRIGEPARAAVMNRRARILAPDWPAALIHGARLEALHGNPAVACALGERAIAADPVSADARSARALALFAAGNKEAAISEHRRSLVLAPDVASEWNDRGAMLKPAGLLQGAGIAFGRARLIEPALLAAINNHATLLFDMTDMEGAAAAYDTALALAPGDAALAMKRAMTFPTILRSEAEIDAIRKDVETRMRALKYSGGRIGDPLKDVGRPNFYLAYHGRNDRDLQSLIAETYLVLCPELGFVAPHCRAPRSLDGRRVRIGFLSKFFYDHSVKFISEGIIRNLDPERFEVHLISTMEERDVEIFPPGGGPARYTRIPEDLAEARQDIAALELDILVFGDIGMEPLSYYLGFSRFAPVQCVMQGHPVTTGLPHMDYFVCGALQEIEGCEAHYTESPIRTADIPLCYPELPDVPVKPLSHFGLPEDRTLYFCPQTLFKFHPDFDAILGGILAGDPDGIVVLLKDRQETRNRQLQARLEDTLGTLTERIHWVGRMAKLDYYALLMHSAVMLDTTHFCGGNTTIQALGLGIPPVTLPADYVRGRMTIGWLKAIDVMELVADDHADYVRIALACGTDPQWRARIVAKIEARNQELIENQGCVRELERFFPEAYAAALRGERLRWIAGRHVAE